MGWIDLPHVIEDEWQEISIRILLTRSQLNEPFTPFYTRGFASAPQIEFKSVVTT